MQLKAHELVSILSRLTGMEPKLLALVANVPANNLNSWLTGKQNNLQMRSIKSVMAVLGLDVSDKGVNLHSDRVHSFKLADKKFSKLAGYGQLKLIAPLLEDCAITEVVLAGQKPDPKCRQFMLRGLNARQVRVLITLDLGRFKKAKITPELLKFSSWRDDSEDHILVVKDPIFWARLVTNDLTTYEFDWIFHNSYDQVSWDDVSLMARETGTRPSDMMSFIHQRAEQAHRHGSHSKDHGAAMTLADNVILLSHTG